MKIIRIWKYFMCLSIIFKSKCSGISYENIHNKIGSQHESKLIHYLLEHKQYNPLIRPVSNLSNTLKVELGLALIKIINVEEKSQIMKTNVWLRLKWMDHQLRWEPSDFGNVDVARIHAKRVWQPDIVLFNNADGNYEVSWDPNVLVDSLGSVLWIPPAIFISSCKIHVEYFPFDQQSCEMKFGSWTFDASQLTLGYYEDKDYVDLSDYWKSGSWDLVDCPARMTNTTGTNQSPERQIIYTIIIKRKTLFFTINLIIPCVLISLLTVCVFYLPADAGEKMTLSISILLSLVVFLLLISRILPPTSSSIPLISKFLLFTFIMNIFTITITVMIINWNFRSPNTDTMPRIIRKLFIDFLPKYLLMQRPDQTQLFDLKSSCLPIKNSVKHSDYIAYNRAAGSIGDEICSPSFLRKSYQSLTQEFDSSKTFEKVFDNNNANTTFSSQKHSKNQLHNHNDPWINIRQSANPKPSQSALSNSEYSLNHQKSSKCHCTKKLSHNVVISNHQNPKLSYQNQGGKKAEYSKDSVQSPNKKSEHVANERVKISDRMRRAIKAINFISNHLEVGDNNKKIMQDWKYVAAVFDRIQLVIFTIVTVSGTMGILLKAFSIYEEVNEIDVITKYSNPTLIKS